MMTLDNAITTWVNRYLFRRIPKDMDWRAVMNESVAAIKEERDCNKVLPHYEFSQLYKGELEVIMKNETWGPRNVRK
jgi:hypothetical protein